MNLRMDGGMKDERVKSITSHQSISTLDVVQYCI